MKYYTRKTRILTLLKKRKSLLILGPRGSGKSTYINRLLNDFSNGNIISVNLLETDTFRKYLTMPSHIRQEVDYNLKSSEDLTVFIDEIQKVPELLDEVHLLIERYKGRVVFILPRSSARKLKSKGTNLLAGRALKINFFPLFLEELEPDFNLERVLKYGLLPEAYTETDDELTIDFLKSYTGTYLREEIIQESFQRNIQAFSFFLEICASANAAPVNYKKIATQIGISDNTVRNHFQILEDTLMIHRIPAWTFSVRKQLQKASKFYFFDNGLLNALTGELRSEIKTSSYRYGKLFENFIINEIIKHNEIYAYDYRLFHYRTNHGGEIDLIVQKNIHSDPVAVEIKSSEMPSLSDVKELISFGEEYKNSKRFVLCRALHPYEENGILFLPYREGIKMIFSEAT